MLSWWINLAGSIIMAEIVHAADVYNGNTTFIFYLANKKTHYTFAQCMCRAILANWLVNLAVWIANAAQVRRPLRVRRVRPPSRPCVRALAAAFPARERQHR